MKVQKIINKDNATLAKMPTGGYIEERNLYLEKEGFYAAWAQIFKEYAELALSSRSEQDALKQALFFCWYSLAEPFWLNGLRDLDEELVEKILRHVDSLAESDALDAELIWMIPYYYSVCEYYLERFKGLKSLLAVSQQNESLWVQEIAKSSFKNRGQLGDYWDSIRG